MRTGRPVDCPECGIILAVKDLKLHRANEHGGIKQGQCEWCLLFLGHDYPKDYSHRIYCLKKRLAECESRVYCTARCQKQQQIQQQKQQQLIEQLDEQRELISNMTKHIKHLQQQVDNFHQLLGEEDDGPIL